MTEEIRSFAIDTLGFDLVGIAPAERMEEEGARYEEWLARGYHGSMSWMERNVDRRVDVRSILPSARSVVVLARNYYTPRERVEGAVRISRYAWGRDYHKILPRRLEQLAGRIADLDPAAESRWYVDTGPILEKQWAVRAGLGWMGKHTNVITRELGSWVFLGVLVTSVELEHDASIPDFCGDCTRCIDACPTDALFEPYRLDATRCISYVTIEQKPKEEIAPELARRLEGWAFGCDICQDVCPWNRFEQPTTEHAFEPREGVLDLAPEVLEGMSDEEFLARFAGTPVMRARAEGMRRNARALLRARSDEENVEDAS